MSAHFERQLRKLNQMVAAQAADVAGCVQQAIDAVEKRDTKLAWRVVEHDHVINQVELDIEEECLHTLACYQPVALDLRYVISVLKMNNDLERIADHAVKIAELATFMANEPPADLLVFIDGMTEQVQHMLATVLDALLESDVNKARGVRAADDRVDTAHRRMYEQVETAMREEPDLIPQLVHVMNVSRQLERIADLTVSIAEDVVYAIEGEMLRHTPESPRPRGASQM